jgi:hypothetical protein
MSEIECIDALLPQLSIEQKASFLVGMGINVPGAFSVQQAEKVPGAAGSTYPIPELNIPSMILSDGPAGVRIEPQREGSVWALVAANNQQLPGPVATWHSAVELFKDPFYSNGPNDQGIGWNILNSLQRVAIGFGLAALVGIPLGFVIGRVKFFNDMFAPIISLLRPVSPLAWLPIGVSKS